MRKIINQILIAILSALFGYQAGNPDSMARAYLLTEPQEGINSFSTVPPELADDNTVIDPDPKAQYWYCFVDYWIKDTAQSGIGVPGGQVYEYLYPYPGRLMIRSVYRPTEKTLEYIPEAIRALGLEAKPAYVRAYNFGQ